MHVACSMEKNLELYNNAFTFNLQPFEKEYDCFPVHVLPKSDGSADEGIRKMLTKIVNILKVNYINVIFIASDGDTGYNIYHKISFDKWINSYNNQSIEEAVNVVKNSIHPIGDFLHLLKNARSRLLSFKIKIFPDPNSSSIEVKKLLETLNLKKVFSDKSQLGKMRDSYILKLYNISNVLICLENKMLLEALYLLTYAAWMEALRNPNISVADRLVLIQLSFELFLMHIRNIRENIVNNHNFPQDTQYFHNEMHCIRCANTLLGTISAITSYPSNLGLD